MANKNKEYECIKNLLMIPEIFSNSYLQLQIAIISSQKS